MFDLSGRRFLVTGTGSAQGIGFAAARALHQLGASVFLTSLSPRVHERAGELNASSATADLTDPAAVVTLIASAVEKLGGLDGLVNNAGMTSVVDEASEEFAAIDRIPLATWRKSFARNVDSAYLVTQAALPHLRQRPGGRIVMVSSTTGTIAGTHNAIAWLCSPGASYITGQLIIIDGGNSIAEERAFI
jgi:3-oxoacyl-[acyl-carrier protein] reductase